MRRTRKHAGKGNASTSDVDVCANFSAAEFRGISCACVMLPMACSCSSMVTSFLTSMVIATNYIALVFLFRVLIFPRASIYCDHISSVVCDGQTEIAVNCQLKPTHVAVSEYSWFLIHTRKAQLKNIHAYTHTHLHIHTHTH